MRPSVPCVTPLSSRRLRVSNLSSDPLYSDEMRKERKVMERKLKNRHSAMLSRERKNNKMKELEDQNNLLISENEYLKALLRSSNIYADTPVLPVHYHTASQCKAPEPEVFCI